MFSCLVMDSLVAALLGCGGFGCEFGVCGLVVVVVFWICMGWVGFMVFLRWCFLVFGVWGFDFVYCGACAFAFAGFLFIVLNAVALRLLLTSRFAVEFLWVVVLVILVVYGVNAVVLVFCDFAFSGLVWYSLIAGCECGVAGVLDLVGLV